jgi:hypothetical protein
VANAASGVSSESIGRQFVVLGLWGFDWTPKAKSTFVLSDSSSERCPLEDLVAAEQLEVDDKSGIYPLPLGGRSASRNRRNPAVALA